MLLTDKIYNNRIVIESFIFFLSYPVIILVNNIVNNLFDFIYLNEYKVQIVIWGNLCKVINYPIVGMTILLIKYVSIAIFTTNLILKEIIFNPPYLLKTVFKFIIYYDIVYFISNLLFNLQISNIKVYLFSFKYVDSVLMYYNINNNLINLACIFLNLFVLLILVKKYLVIIREITLIIGGSALIILITETLKRIL